MNEKHLNQIYDIVKKFCKDNNWPFDDKTKDFITDCVVYGTDEYSFFEYKVDDKDCVSSLMVGEIYNHPFSNLTIATEWFVYSNEGLGQTLMSMFLNWAKEQKADVVYATAPNTRVDHWLERQGFQFKEKAYIKWL